MDSARRSRSVANPDAKRFDRYDLTERLYIGLYRYDDPDRGALRCFDVMHDPPRNGIPPESATLSLDQLVDQIKKLVDERNSTSIEWATLTEEIEDVEDGDE